MMQQGYTCTAYNGFGKLENQAVSVIVTSEYALKTTLTNVKHRCTFLIYYIFCILLCAVIFFY